MTMTTILIAAIVMKTLPDLKDRYNLSTSYKRKTGLKIGISSSINLF